MASPRSAMDRRLKVFYTADARVLPDQPCYFTCSKQRAESWEHRGAPCRIARSRGGLSSEVGLCASLVGARARIVLHAPSTGRRLSNPSQARAGSTNPGWAPRGDRLRVRVRGTSSGHLAGIHGSFGLPLGGVGERQGNLGNARVDKTALPEALSRRLEKIEYHGERNRTPPPCMARKRVNSGAGRHTPVPGRRDSPVASSCPPPCHAAPSLPLAPAVTVAASAALAAS